MDINKLRELRKLINILQTWGNTIVPGGLSAKETLQNITQGFLNEGYTLEQVQEGVYNLDKAGYPDITT